MIAMALTLSILVLLGSLQAVEIRVEALLGGALEGPGAGGALVPWFRASEQGVGWAGAGREARLLLQRGAWLEAPIALPPPALAPLAPGPLRVRLKGAGPARLGLAVRRAEAAICREVAMAGAQEITWELAERPRPRAVLRLEVLEGALQLEHLSCEVAWPRFSVAEMRSLLDEEISWLAACLEGSRDADGPLETAFLTRRVDPLTGELLGHRPAGHHPYYDALLEAYLRAPAPALREKLLGYARDLLRCGIDAGTGLPRLHDGPSDEPLGEHAVDPRGALEFLMDARRALALPEALERAIARTLMCARRTLRAGQAPDGSWSSRWIPASGAPAPDMPIVRALRTAALVARIERELGLPREEEAALEALLQLELRLHWPGSAALPDPGLDDYLGHLGGDALELCAGEAPQGPFRRFLEGGLEHYRPLWRAAQRAGGSNAPDQVRAFELFLECAAGSGERGAVLGECLASWRNLARSTQLPDGCFADVTAVGFEPRLNMPVGDLPLVPFHLLRLGARLHASEELAEAERAELRSVCACALLALRALHRGRAGYGRGDRGQDATARLFIALVEWRGALR